MNNHNKLINLTNHVNMSTDDDQMLVETRALSVSTTFTNEECEVLYDNGTLQVYLPHTREVADKLGTDYWNVQEKLYIIKLEGNTYVFHTNSNELLYCTDYHINGFEAFSKYDHILIYIPKFCVDYIAMLMYDANAIQEFRAYHLARMPAEKAQEVTESDNATHARIKEILSKVSQETLNNVLHTRMFNSYRELYEDNATAHTTCALLLEVGADPNARDEHGRNALFYYDSPESVRMLIAAGADPRMRDYDGLSILEHDGIWNHSTDKEAVGIILSYKRYHDTNVLSKLLLYAIEQEDIEYIQMLLNAGADPYVRIKSKDNDNGKNVYEILNKSCYEPSFIMQAKAVFGIQVGSYRMQKCF